MLSTANELYCIAQHWCEGTEEDVKHNTPNKLYLMHLLADDAHLTQSCVIRSLLPQACKWS
jgi:hypothetical protein